MLTKSIIRTETGRLTELPVWQALLQHQIDVAPIPMRHWFLQDKQRHSRFSVEYKGMLFDYCRNRISAETLSLLLRLAYDQGLPQKIAALFAGSPVNTTERRPALHAALRDSQATPLYIDGQNIRDLINISRDEMLAFIEKIESGAWRGVQGDPIQSVVNIGIGGSYLGPMMTSHALCNFSTSRIRCHFLSGIDSLEWQEILQQINPATTLFIISSKSFSTLETLTNARTLLAWMQNQFGPTVLAKNFIAITAAPEKAQQFGLPLKNIFRLWDWVGGRYSIWSATGLPLALLIGKRNFLDFLAGAHEMDVHFQQADFASNIPVLMGLLGIWYRNFFATHAQAITPYSHALRHLPAYLQQAEMESNGKQITHGGTPTACATAPIIFGGEGCNAQHAYYQLLHQGQHLIPVDFILVGQDAANPHDPHHDILVASGLSQAQAFMYGKSHVEAHAELVAKGYSHKEANLLAHHQTIPGNKPSNILFLNKMSPKNLGALLALYEHKIFVQSAIWDINSFDQWGVELGKNLLPPILESLQGKQANVPTNSTVENLIAYYQKDQQGKTS